MRWLRILVIFAAMLLWAHDKYSHAFVPNQSSIEQSDSTKKKVKSAKSTSVKATKPSTPKFPTNESYWNGAYGVKKDTTKVSPLLSTDPAMNTVLEVNEH